MKKARLKAGDLFEIPLRNGSSGCVQLAEKYQGVLLYCVFYPAIPSNLLKPDHSKVILAGITLGARIHHGFWPYLGNSDSHLKEIKRPFYKVMMESSPYLEDLSGSYRKKISHTQAEQLNNRSIVAPIRFEKALAAHLGEGEWNPAYDELLYSEVLRSRDVVSSWEEGTGNFLTRIFSPLS